MLSGDKSTKWGCSKCRGDEWAEGDRYRESRGCDGPPTGNLAFAFDPSLRRCPWSQVKADTWQLVEWWLAWDTFSALPWGGQDVMQQPAYVLEVLELCETTKRESQAREHKRQSDEIDRARKRAGNGR